MSKQKKSKKIKDVEVLVYYVGNKPDTVYKYYNKPEIGDKPYAVIEGYWLPVDDGKDKPTYHFVENENKRPMLIDREWLMNKIIPDAKSVKCFDSMDDFIIEMI